MKLLSLVLAAALGVAGCASLNDGDPRTQLERNLDVPVELAGTIHPARLAQLKFILDSDDIYTQYEQEKYRRLILSGAPGLTLTF